MLLILMACVDILVKQNVTNIIKNDENFDFEDNMIVFASINC